MKKLLLIVLTTVLSVALYSQNKLMNKDSSFDANSKSLTRGEWAMKNGTFSANDINGNPHDLNSYLNAGKTVIIDFSACWCEPCWDLHQSGVFENLHNNYGPDGTDELVVLWVEIESTNTINQITGTSTSNTYAGYTQGDWTINGTWPVPIIDNRNLLSPFLALYEGSVPTVFMVCPSGYYKDITTEAWNGAAAVYSQIGSCPASGQVPIAEIIGPGSGYINNSLSFTASVTSVDPVTTYAWTFEGGTPAVSDQVNPSVSWVSDGEYEITLTVSNATGTSNTATKTITIIDPGNINDKSLTFEEIVVGDLFATSMAPYSWTTYDGDGGTVWGDFSDYGVSGASSSFYVYSHDLAGFVTPYAGDKCGFAMTNNPSSGNHSYNNDWLISSQITLGSASSLKMYVRASMSNYGNEQYKIGVSTTDNNTSSFAIIGGTRSVGANWTEVNVDLSEYDGRQVYVAINYVSQDIYAFMIDNIEILTQVSAEEEIGVENINVYPNPANDVINITSAEGANIKILNMMGQELINLNGSSELQKIDISNLTQGVYVVQITKDNNTFTSRITVTK